ncbi:hypothetical protein [Pedobacter sp.]
MKIWGNNFLSQQVLPGLYSNWVAKKFITPRIAALKKVSDFDHPKKEIENFTTQLLNDLQNQLDRKKGLEDKIKSILFVVSVSITAVTFCLKDVNSSSGSLIDICVLACLGLSICYFVGAAVLALKALVPIEFHDSTSEITFDDETNKIKLSVPKPQNDIKELLRAKLLNDAINLKVQNRTNAVLVLVRNGIILFAAFFLTALIEKQMTQDPIKKDKNSVGKEIKLNRSQGQNIKLDTSVNKKSKSEQSAKRDSITIQHKDSTGLVKK